MPGRFKAVFGVGLPKTGTTTLGHMFKALHFKHAPYDPALIHAVAYGDLSGLADHIAKYDSFEDWPWPIVMQQVAELAPDSGFILTRRRSPAIWLKSVRMHTERNPSERSRHLRRVLFGSDDPWRDELTYLNFYEGHLEHVRSLASDYELPLLELCWEEGDGWAKLCNWLSVEVVQGEVPHRNSAPERESLQKRLRRMAKQRLNRLLSISRIR